MLFSVDEKQQISLPTLPPDIGETGLSLNMSPQQ